MRRHFRQTDFVNFTRHALNPFVVPSRLETESNLISILSAFFDNDPKNTNYLQPLNSVIKLPLVCDDSHAMSASIDVTDSNNNSSSVNNEIVYEDAPNDINVTNSSCEDVVNVKNISSHTCSKSGNKENCDPIYCIHDNTTDDTDNETINNDNSIASTVQTTPKKENLVFCQRQEYPQKK